MAQGETYLAFIAAQVESEQTRKAAHEARGHAVITSSATLLTLVSALTAVVTGTGYKFGPRAVIGVVIALALFMAGGISGLRANRLEKYKVPKTSTLQAMLQEKWAVSETTARNSCGWLLLDTLTSLRLVNEKKAKRISQAHFFQLAAVAVLALSLACELIKFLR